MFIPEIKRSIILRKQINGKGIAKALQSISHSFGTYIERLQSDVDGLRTFDIGILKDTKHPQTGQIIRAESIKGLDALGLETGIVFDKLYNGGDKIIVANYRWSNQTICYNKYNEEKVIKAVESLKIDLAIRLDSIS